MTGNDRIKIWREIVDELVNRGKKLEENLLMRLIKNNEKCENFDKIIFFFFHSNQPKENGTSFPLSHQDPCKEILSLGNEYLDRLENPESLRIVLVKIPLSNRNPRFCNCLSDTGIWIFFLIS